MIKLTTFDRHDFQFNYNSMLSNAIDKILKLRSTEFLDYLNKIGFKTKGNPYRLFTFALRFEKAEITPSCFKLISPNLYLYISFPLIDEFINDYVLSSLKDRRTICSADNKKRTCLKILSVDILPEPEFSNKMKFLLFSPMVLSTKVIFNKHLSTYYLRYDDDIKQINNILTKNLLNKYRTIAYKTRHCPAGQVEIEWDQQYIAEKRTNQKKITTKTTIMKSGRKFEIVGNMLPFTIKGDPELIRTGYLCGFGDKNYMGFGMVENICDN